MPLTALTFGYHTSQGRAAGVQGGHACAGRRRRPGGEAHDRARCGHADADGHRVCVWLHPKPLRDGDALPDAVAVSAKSGLCTLLSIAGKGCLVDVGSKVASAYLLIINGCTSATVLVLADILHVPAQEIRCT